MTATEKPDVLSIVPDLEYSAEFVPQSKSRNAGDKNQSLNWLVTLKTPRAALTTDYMQGIGHLPGYNAERAETVDGAATMKAVAESGQYSPADPMFGRIHLRAVPAPDLTDVMHSLLMDAEAIDYVDYEEWAGNCGYDPDSRKAEAIYRACVEIGLKLRNMLGDETIGTLRDLLQDY